MSRTPSLLLSTVFAVALLSACGRPADAPVAGQNNDSVVSDASTSTPPATGARGAVGDAAQTVTDTAKDIAISAEIKTLLARDDQLSALKIDVDTDAGQVMLQGTAPTERARNRAAELSLSVAGVLGVNNQLQLETRN